MSDRWPVVEMFGPTLQGEGVDQGVPCYFIRFGGCDFKCDWCDTPYAVIPEEVKQNSEMLSIEKIMGRLHDLYLDPEGGQYAVPQWIILSGGNPALLELGPLVKELQASGYLVAVETQGSKWKPWIADVDRVCLSPKPPSSMQNYQWRIVEEFIRNLEAAERTKTNISDWWFVKVPIFDGPDLTWAKMVRSALAKGTKLYLSAGNNASRTVGSPTRADARTPDEVRLDLLSRSKILTDRVLRIEELCTPTTIVQSQYHVLLWGNEKGR